MGRFRGFGLRVLRSPWGLIGALMIMLLGAAFLTQVVPYGQIVESRQAVADAREQLAGLEAENAELAADVAALGTDAEIEKLAREKLGYVRPGETAYVVLDPPSVDAEPSDPAPDVPAVDDSTWVDKVWSFLTGADAES